MNDQIESALPASLRPDCGTGYNEFFEHAHGKTIPRLWVVFLYAGPPSPPPELEAFSERH
jgi:hypothetical protein